MSYLSIKLTGFLLILILSVTGFLTGMHIEKNKIYEERDETENGKRTRLIARRAALWQKEQTADTPPLGIFTGEKNKRTAAILTKILNGQAPVDWEKELQMILKNTDPWSAGCALRIYFCKWAEVDFQAALERAGKLGYLAQSVKEEMFTQLAKKDPLAAISLYETNKDILQSEKNSIMKEIVRYWAALDDEQAWAWYSSLSNKEKEQIFPEFIKGLGWESKDVRKYMDMVDKNVLSRYSDLIKEWTTFNPEEAWDWVNPISSPFSVSYRQNALAGMASTDLDRALGILDQFPREQQWLYVSAIAGAMEDRAQALKLILDSNLPSDIREHNLTPLSEWINESPSEAKKWIERQNSSDIRNISTEIYAKNADSPRQYDETLSLIDNIQNPQTKEEILINTLEYWNAHSPESFHQWLKDHHDSSLIQKVKQKGYIEQ